MLRGVTRSGSISDLASAVAESLSNNAVRENERLKEEGGVIR